MRAFVPLLLGWSACQVTPAIPEDPDAGSDPALMDLPDGEDDAEADSRAALSPFELAAEEFDVPVELLLAVSQVETSMQEVVGEEEFPGQPKRLGVMGLSEARLDRAATLAGLDPDAVRKVRRHQIAASAALLSWWAEEAQIDRSDLSAWAPVVARWSDIEDPDAQAHYVWDEVYRALRKGVSAEGIEIAGQRVTPDFPEPAERLDVAGAQRSYAVWRPSPNTSSRPSGTAGQVQAVVIHTCEGSYSGCWSWLVNGSSGVSAHYVVNTDGSEVSQLVREETKAWHAGATYDCTRNGNQMCSLSGRSSNDFTVGIEHAGYASQTSWSSGLISKSVQLVADITADHNIPVDSYHIVAHGTLDPYRRVDPGPNWPWTSYLADIRARRGLSGGSGGSSGGSGGSGGSTPSAAPIIIDSNNSYNDVAKGYIAVSSSWTSSASVSGYYHTGYWWRSAGTAEDAAQFWFYTPTPTCMAADAWWSAASDRAPNAPFVAVDASGRTLGTRNVDQRVNGGRWNAVGTYNFPAGWNKINLSRRATTGTVVVADAVRVTPSTACAGTPAPGAVNITIDDDPALNGTTARFEASTMWYGSTSISGFYGSGYDWRDTGASSDPANFWFYIPSQTRLIVESRWTAGTNRSSTAPYMAYDTTGNLIATVSADQTRNHGAWVTLGTWTFPAGWNRVALSRWTTPGKVVVADAVRVRTAP
jgi:hypothetical protein